MAIRLLGIKSCPCQNEDRESITRWRAWRKGSSSDFQTLRRIWRTSHERQLRPAELTPPSCCDSYLKSQKRTSASWPTLSSVQHVPFISEHPANCRQLAAEHAPFEISPRAQFFWVTFFCGFHGGNHSVPYFVDDHSALLFGCGGLPNLPRVQSAQRVAGTLV